MVFFSFKSPVFLMMSMTGVFEQVSGRVEKKERFAHWFRASGWLAVGPLRVEIVEMKIELVFFFFFRGTGMVSAFVC